ncbi:MAG: type II toxin-antitoxin system VapC family toxin [Candidatus Hydrothermarchaeales archaeon]
MDTNIFVYVITTHPKFGETAKSILGKIERGEKALTSLLVLLEVSWVLEAMGKQGYIKSTLDKISSYNSLEIEEVSLRDLQVGATLMAKHEIDINDSINLAIMERRGIKEVYSNDKKHLGKIKGLELTF